MAFIDGKNLFRHAKDAFGDGFHWPNYDPMKLHQRVCEHHGWAPNLVRFYTGVPDKTYDPPGAQTWSNRILAMKRSGVHVTTRKLRYSQIETFEDGVSAFKHVPREKGIDVRLALDVVKCARTRQFDVAVIYSQDQDLSEVVAEVREIGHDQKRDLKICCAFPDAATVPRARGIDNTDWFRMSKEFYAQCLDPKDYRSKSRP